MCALFQPKHFLIWTHNVYVVLDFVSDGAIEDAWCVSSYLADADLLLADIRGKMSGHNKTEDILQSAGASVAMRGVLYGNKQPWSSRFLLHSDSS